MVSPMTNLTGKGEINIDVSSTLGVSVIVYSAGFFTLINISSVKEPTSKLYVKSSFTIISKPSS